MTSHVQKVINNIKKFCKKKCKKYDSCTPETSNCPLCNYKLGENPWYKPAKSSPEIKAKRAENMAKAREIRMKKIEENKPIEFEEQK